MPLAFLAVAALLFAESKGAISGVTGVWDGSIGNLPVRVCFDGRGPDDLYGVYFYRSKLVTIPLIQDDKAPSSYTEGWADQPNVPRWKIAPVGQNKLGGTWQQGPKSLPVQLARVPLPEDETPCGSMEFERPRMAGLRVVRSRSVKDGVPFTRMALDHRGHFPSISVESFELGGNGPAITRINAELAKPFDRSSDDNWLGCVRGAYPWGGDYNESLEPRMISRRWLVVNDHWDGFCGGAHPDSSNSARIFDLSSGLEIDIRDWFNSKAIKSQKYPNDPEVFKTIQPGFRQFIIGNWKGDEECADTIDQEDWWNYELTRTGFRFTPSLAHVVQACEEDFDVPFARLSPYLTPEARDYVAALQAERTAGR